ncbi:MAG: phosphotyrosine protein phosphatase, partial [Agathobacter sp.]|nr:phosphotyrosine protein phosphatase [Agathobacter sp.]
MEVDMRPYNRIVFLGRSGNLREPMAMLLAKESFLDSSIEILSRGLVVSFPEPMNQKAEAVLISNGVAVNNFTSTAFTERDITPDTLILTMGQEIKERAQKSFPSIRPDQIEVLTEFVGEELEIIDPYGGTLTAYGLCYES